MDQNQITLPFGYNAKIRFLYPLTGKPVEENIDYFIFSINIFPHFDFSGRLYFIERAYINAFAKSFSMDGLPQHEVHLCDGPYFIKLGTKTIAGREVYITLSYEELEYVEIIDKGVMLPYNIGDTVSLTIGSMNLVEYPAKRHVVGDPLRIVSLNLKRESMSFLSEEGYPWIRGMTIWYAVLSNANNQYISMINGSNPMSLRFEVPIANLSLDETYFLENITRCDRVVDNDRFDRFWRRSQ